MPGVPDSDLPVAPEAETVGAALRAVLSPSGLRAVAVELGWASAHVLTYPWGVAEERVRDMASGYSTSALPPTHRGRLSADPAAARTPILLVHGVADNRSVFSVMARSLHRKGFGRVVAVNQPPLGADVPTLASRLGERVEALCAATGYERLHIIGHSLGGLVARYYAQCQGGDARVHTLVTLGTPHAGTQTARLVPLPLARQLRPGSAVITELAGPAPGCATRFLAIWSDLDQMVIPRRSAALSHPDLMVRTLLVPGVGHLSLPIDARVVAEVCTALAHLDREGDPRGPYSFSTGA